jgi:hypothetical protein
MFPPGTKDPDLLRRNIPAVGPTQSSTVRSRRSPGPRAAITRWLLVPSLLPGLEMFEGTLLTVQSSAARAAEIAALAASSGHSDPAQLDPLLRTEWAGLWTMLVLSFANIVLAIWRPRIRRKP